MRRLLVALVLLAGCGGEDDGDPGGKALSTDEEVWQTYLEVGGYTEDEAPGDRQTIVDLSKSMCDMEGLELATFLDGIDGTGGQTMAVELTKVRCPDQTYKFR